MNTGDLIKWGIVGLLFLLAARWITAQVNSWANAGVSSDGSSFNSPYMAPLAPPSPVEMWSPPYDYYEFSGSIPFNSGDWNFDYQQRMNRVGGGPHGRRHGWW